MITEPTYWSLYTASAKKIARLTGNPIQAVLRDAMLLWDFFECPPHEGLWLYWEGYKAEQQGIAERQRVLH